MSEKGTAMAGTSKKFFSAGFAAAALIVVGCGAAPTIKDVEPETMTADAHIVFGTVDVFGTKGKRQEWGMGWTGANVFYLTILPSTSSEATTYKLDKDGAFYWSLAPGDYTLLGWHWNHKQEQRSNYLGIPFSVPASGGDGYIGSFVFQAYPGGLIPKIEDRFDLVAPLYDQKFPGRTGLAVKRVVEFPEEPGAASSYKSQCHDEWQIECTKRFRGVTPVSPEVTKSGFPLIDTRKPQFRWQASANPDISYDFILYEAATYSFDGLARLYMRGHRVAFEEDLKQASWTSDTPLKPNMRYYWSVRMREGDTVSYWSTHSHFTFALIYTSSGYGQWFQFRTP